MASGGGLSPNRAGHRCASASSLSVPDIDWDAPWLADWRALLQAGAVAAVGWRRGLRPLEGM